MRGDPEVAQESLLALAQATIEMAVRDAGITRTQLAGRMGRLKGEHNLTVKTFARAIHACGFEVEIALRPLDKDGAR